VIDEQIRTRRTCDVTRYEGAEERKGKRKGKKNEERLVTATGEEQRKEKKKER
jgi:hypothetical protein